MQKHGHCLNMYHTPKYMKTRFAITAAAIFCSINAFSQESPTMGWSSWNTFALNINEDIIKGQTDAMVSTGLSDAGYRFINIDDGYFGGRNPETGKLLIHPTRFPNGLRPLVDYIHSKGLKAGIYSDAGHNTCGNFWGGDSIGQGVGMYEHDQQDADLFFKELDFDFIKVDYCGGVASNNSEKLNLDERQRYTDIAQAIRNTGRTDVRMNACRWDFPGTWIKDVAFSWRTTFDIYDSWKAVKDILAENLYLSAYCYDGRYNDMDMLEVGRSMTAEEDKTHFGMWCIMTSPLLIGCDMTKIKEETLALLKNRELIALNQDSLHLQAYIAEKQNSCFVMVKDIETRFGNRRAFAVYNPTDAQKTVMVEFSKIDLAGKVSLRDVYEQTDLGEFETNYTVTIPAHGTRIYVADAETRLERTRYEAETGYISDYQELKNNETEETGVYIKDSNCSGGYKAGWLGKKNDNDLIWRDVYSLEGGKYTMTVAFISGENRNITIHVNGEKAKTVTLNGDSWSNVAKKDVVIQLKKGVNTIRLSNNDGWMPDIDYIDLVCNNPQTGIKKKVAENNSYPGNNIVYNLDGRIDNSKNSTQRVVIKNHRKQLVK